MSVTTHVRRPEQDELRIRGSPGRSDAGRLLPSLLLVQGMAFLFLIGLAGSPLWRGLRMLAVVGITAAAAMYSRRAALPGRGATALVLGIAGTVAGAGIGGVYLAKVGVSVLTVAGMICLVTGLWLLGWGAAMLARALPGWWRLLVAPVALLLLAFVLTR
jgi:hypothetical protein